jgi:ABC-type amino acid transport substrate-binding protein
MLMQKNKVNYRTKFVTEADLMQGVADKEVDAVFVSSMQYWWYLKNNPDVKLSALTNFDFEREVSLNVGVLMRGPDQVTVIKINEILSNLLDQGVIQNIYASYGIKYVAPN